MYMWCIGKAKEKALRIRLFNHFLCLLYHLTQQELAYKFGIGLRFVRELEQGKSTVRVDKVNQVLELFILQEDSERLFHTKDISENFINPQPYFGSQHVRI